MLTTTILPVDGGAGSDESTIMAGDFSRLLLGIRSDIRVKMLKTSTYASNLQYTMLAHLRADVAVTHPGAFYTITGVGKAANETGRANSHALCGGPGYPFAGLPILPGRGQIL